MKKLISILMLLMAFTMSSNSISDAPARQIYTLPPHNVP